MLRLFDIYTQHPTLIMALFALWSSPASFEHPHEFIYGYQQVMGVIQHLGTSAFSFFHTVASAV